MDVAAHVVRNASLQKTRRDVSFLDESTYKASHYIHIVFAHPLFVFTHRVYVCLIHTTFTFVTRFFLLPLVMFICIHVLTPHASQDDSACVCVSVVHV